MLDFSFRRTLRINLGHGRLRRFDSRGQIYEKKVLDALCLFIEPPKI